MKFLSEYESPWADARKKFLIKSTGGMRFRRPVTDYRICRQCGWCYLYCPVGCIKVYPNGYFIPDFDYCKGCGICASECPACAISLVDE